MRALVTGASGCLGRALVEELEAEGWTLRTTARRPAALPDFHAADLIRADLRPLVAGVDAVFHCAALSTAWGSRAAFEAANVTATERLLRAAREAGVARFVLASTPSLYADGTHRLDVAEHAPLPRRSPTPYADSKRRAEALVLAADSAMRCSAIRPRAIYGRHDRALLPRLRAALSRGRVPMIDGGGALIDLTHRRDAARAMRLAAGGPGGRGLERHLGAGLVLPRAGRDGRAAGRMRVPARGAALPRGAGDGVGRGGGRAPARLGGWAEPALTRQAVVSLGRSLTLDIGAARRELGYRPAVTLEEGLAECFA